MSNEVTDAFKTMVDRKILDVAYLPLASYIGNNYTCLNLTYKSNVVENVDEATLLDFELIKVDNVIQDDDKLTFKVVVSAEIEIEETVHRDREVDNVYKWFTLICQAEIDDLAGTISVNSVEVY